MKILVVDDHSLIREALRGVLRELRPDALVLEASNAAKAMGLVVEHPDLGLILLDLSLPDRDGLAVLAELRERYPAISIVVLSAMQDRGTVANSLDLGAVGFIPKSGQRQVMLSALKLVFAGGVYIPPEFLARNEPLHSKSSLKRSITDLPRGSPLDIGLTGRQLDVLAHMMQGKSNKAISRTLNLAVPTVKNHVTGILMALKVTNRTEAVIAVNELRWDLAPIASS
jgi:DNA-binding NarL/FixJ family response regulator